MTEQAPMVEGLLTYREAAVLIRHELNSIDARRAGREGGGDG